MHSTEFETSQTSGDIIELINIVGLVTIRSVVYCVQY